ncbi:MAG: oxidoreductase [Candidatus Latescibacteria bacterium]|nr:oxidoreductase [Candidatus Latescibacterota bacterium]
MKTSEFDIKHPYQATITRSERITDENTDEVRHIVLNVADATFHYIEGQSIGVLVPGPHAYGNENHFRLYSIASARQGENQDMTEISICVRRCFYIDEFSGERFPGVASNFLCDKQPGDFIQLAGPYGRHFLPPRDNTCNLLMIGVGTGIAPFRAFMKHIYEERKVWRGQVRLFYGGRTGLDLLYMNEKNGDLSQYYDQETFKAFESLSPKPHFDEPEEVEQTLKDNAEEVWNLVQDPKTFVYASGLSRLEVSMEKALTEFAGSWDAWKKLKQEMVDKGRWATLFYDDPQWTIPDDVADEVITMLKEEENLSHE